MSNPPVAGAGSGSQPSSAPDCWAEVRAQQRVTRYRRSGVGRAVLLLQSSEEANAVWPELLDVLGARFRLIIPDATTSAGDTPEWLADFMEGLGMSNVGILAATDFALPALQLALLRSDQITRVVLALSGDEEESVRQASQKLTVPLLVVRRAQAPTEVLEAVSRFLAGEGGD